VQGQKRVAQRRELLERSVDHGGGTVADRAPDANAGKTRFRGLLGVIAPASATNSPTFR
jgi:hypothetical protein